MIVFCKVTNSCCEFKLLLRGFKVINEVSSKASSWYLTEQITEIIINILEKIWLNADEMSVRGGMVSFMWKSLTMSQGAGAGTEEGCKWRSLNMSGGGLYCDGTRGGPNSEHVWMGPGSSYFMFTVTKDIYFATSESSVIDSLFPSQVRRGLSLNYSSPSLQLTRDSYFVVSPFLINSARDITILVSTELWQVLCYITTVRLIYIYLAKCCFEE